MSSTHPTLDAVDRLAGAFQASRQWRRRTHRRIAAAVAAGNVPAVRAAITRYRAVVAWERRTEWRYLRAVLAEHTWAPRKPTRPPKLKASSAHPERRADLPAGAARSTRLAPRGGSAPMVP